ncbi:MAG: hypothetical protein OEZ68_16585 [Gammaproteobacteria bacterium]|nr:hypothetical protein [Gammaproteobacteria bacterium]MDH5802420.1 hypothetical protein [Gammaproteobacteria bacterium]
MRIPFFIFVTIFLAACGTMPLPVDISNSSRVKTIAQAQLDALQRDEESVVPSNSGAESLTAASTSPPVTVVLPKDSSVAQQDSQGSVVIETISHSGKKRILERMESNAQIQTSAATPNVQLQPPMVPRKSMEKQKSKISVDVAPIMSSEASVERHVKRAIEKLKSGNEHRARLELSTALDKRPDYADAQILLQQIDQTPSEYFQQSSYFEHKVRAGETLASLAEQYLGSHLMFYMLAKYNDFSGKISVNPGMILKVPGTKPKISPDSDIAEQSIEQIQTLTKSQRLIVDEAKSLMAEEKYLSAIDILSSVKNPSSEVEDMLDNAYITYSSELIARLSLLEAQALLESALSSRPESRRLKKQLVLVQSRREAEKLFKIGLSELSAGNEVEAYEVFSKAIELNPKHLLAKKRLTSIKGSVVKEYHKRAMEHYMKQELKQAIKIWDEILEMDPAHAMARVYVEKAKVLQKRLKQL